MLTAFLITTLVFFSLSLMLSLLTIGVSVASDNLSFPIIQAINVLILLSMITWNIVILVNN